MPEKLLALKGRCTPPFQGYEILNAPLARVPLASSLHPPIRSRAGSGLQVHRLFGTECDCCFARLTSSSNEGQPLPAFIIHHSSFLSTLPGSGPAPIVRRTCGRSPTRQSWLR